MPRADLWTCADCGRQFANRNQQHSCVKRTVGDFLAGQTDHARALFSSFTEAALACGAVTYAPTLTRVGLQARMIFAAVNRLSDDHLDAHVVLSRRLEHPRFYKIESISPRNHVHHFRLHHVSEVDSDVRAWLQEAYAVGEQKHLSR
jgi:hypothetical protein